MGEEAEEEAPEKYPIGGTQAFLLHFLLLQSGLDSTVVTGDLRGNSRVWCAFSLDGKWYHCDPNCEMTDNGGTGLFYFGMTDAYRENEGYTNQSVGCALPEQQAIYRHLNSEGDAMPVDSPALSLTADDDRFAVFRESFYAEVNDQGAAAYYVGAEEAGVYQFH